MTQLKKLWLIIPCYNEEEALPLTLPIMKEKMSDLISRGKIDPDSHILLVNDGSKDRTWELIQKYHEDKLVYGVNLSRNKGHQNALLAGLYTAKDYCDFTITMDCDLQDDIHAIDKMVDEYLEGFDVVYGVRSSRQTDTAFKRVTAETYYKVLEHMGAQIIYNHADFRLLSKRALEALMQYKEVNLFLRGLVPMVGYPSTTVEYERKERMAGESKYPLHKMLSFAFEGITSLSTKPIQWISRLGLGVFLISIFMLIYSVVQYFRGKTVAGWASIITSIWAIGGLILLSIGVIGEYIGKNYLESKERPRFIIQEKLID